jgi:hypothetical protein
VCGSVWQCAGQCAALHAALCAQCARQCAAVPLVVYGSAAVREWQRGSVWQSARLCAGVRAAVFESVWQCVTVRTVVCTRQCVAVCLIMYDSACGSVRQCATVRQCAAVQECAAVRQCAAE